MTQTPEATFDGKVFRPTEAVEFKPDTRVRLIVTDQSTADAFDEWQALLTVNEEDDCAAIQQALDEMDAGDHGTPWKVFDIEFRQKHLIDGIAIFGRSISKHVTATGIG